VAEPGARAHDWAGSHQLELFHPAGHASRTEVVRNSVGPEGDADPIDLLLLLPERGTARDRRWPATARRLADRVGPDGLVLAAPGRSLRAALSAAGLVPTARLLHVPDVERSRYVVSLATPAARFAIAGGIPLGRMERLAARGLNAVAPTTLGPVTVAYQRPGSKTILHWLGALGALGGPDGGGGPVSALVARSWRARGNTVVFRFRGAAEPDAVVKLGTGSRREAAALAGVAPGAGRAGVRVPVSLLEDELGGRPLVLTSTVSGASAAQLLAGSESQARAVLAELGAWLSRWNASTAAAQPWSAAAAERLVLSPARLLAPVLPPGYLARLEGICARAEGTPLPFVAAHNDLTVANVLIGKEPLGIVDWEEAERSCPPLGDLVYAAVDAAAAVDRYRDRPAAFRATFGPGHGALAGQAAGLLRESASKLGLRDEQFELCVHAAWLRHAANEARAAARGAAEGDRPFLAILRELASSR
jgi:hypothetical protein